MKFDDFLDIDAELINQDYDVWREPGEPGPCIECGLLTHTVELNFEAWVCSEEHALSLWERYCQAQRRGAHD